MIDQIQHAKLLKAGELTHLDFQKIRDSQVNARIFIQSGKAKEILESKPVLNQSCIIDTITFTIHKDTFHWCNTDNDVVYEYDQHLKYMLGYGITEQRKNGIYLYDKSYILGQNYGYLAIGGQRDTILVTLSGTGLQFVRESFQNLCYIFLTESNQARITRIDVAYDDYSGDLYSLTNCIQLYDTKQFNNGFRKPTISQVGDWHTDTSISNGRTIYIGSRSSGLYLRIYEKGLQLRNLDLKDWVRAEVEFKSIDRIIPLDILLRPDDYFAGSYPAFNNHSKTQAKIETFKHEISSDLNHRITWAKRQLGNLIYSMQQQGYTDSGIVEALAKDDFPKKHKQQFIPNDLSKVSDGIRATLETTYPAHNFNHQIESEN